MALVSGLRGVGRRIMRGGLWIVLPLLLAACGAPSATATFTPWVSNTPVLRASPTASATPWPTASPTATSTATQTPTPTLPPVTVGTPAPAEREALRETNLADIQELARWGRGRVDALAWSPDGTRLAVATPMGLYVYDADSLELLRFFEVNGAARLAWSADGERLAVAAAGGVQVWSFESGQMLSRIETDGLVLHLTYAAESGALAVVTRLEPAAPIVVATAAGAGQATPSGPTSTPNHPAPRGALVEWWSGDGRDVQRRVSLSAGEISAAAQLSPDGTLLAERAAGGPVRIWRLSDGMFQTSVPETGETPAGLAWSPDGRLLAVSYPDVRYDFLNQNNVRVWQIAGPGDAPDSVPLLRYTLRDSRISPEGAGQTVLSLAWSQDGTHLAAGFGDRVTRVWQPGLQSDAWQRLIGVTLPLSLAWSPDGAQLAAGGLETFRLNDAVKTGYSDDFIPGLFDLDLSPDGSAIALAEYSQIEVRSLIDGTPLQVITGMEGAVNQLDYSPDGSLLAAACADGTARLYRTKDGRYLAALGEPTAPMLAIDFSTNGRWVAAAGEDMRVRVFRVNDGLLMLNLREAYVSYELAFAPNVDQLASLTTNGVVLRAFGGEIQRVAANLQGTMGGVSLHDMVYSPDSRYLALVGNGVIRVADPALRKTVYELYAAGDAKPWSVAFSPDNAFLAVGWSDGTLHLYWAADGTPLNSFQAHPAGITRVIFSADNTLLVTLGAEDTLRLWGVPR